MRQRNVYRHGLRALTSLADWALSPDIVHLNHGSFGGCPRAVLAAATTWRERLEAAPMQFLVLHWQRELDAARAAVAAFVGAEPERLVFVHGATHGVAISLAAAERLTRLAASDEILTTTHTYAACKNQLARLAERTGARIVAVPIDRPFDADALVARIAAQVTARTKLALLDHVTSQSALVLPLERILPLLAGIPVIVDGAHAPGQIALDVGALGATWYTGNHHKWLCAPKASGFLALAPEAVAHTLPLVTSHGATPSYGPANRLHAELDWSGTYEPSAQLAVPTAIATIAALAGGWDAVRARNHALALAMRDALTSTRLAPDAAIGAMVTVPIELPAGVAPLALEKQLLADGWELPIVDAIGGPLVRVSAHLYNSLDQIAPLAAKLATCGVRVL